jgi:hypothetical protein
MFLLHVHLPNANKLMCGPEPHLVMVGFLPNIYQLRKGNVEQRDNVLVLVADQAVNL